MAARWPQIPASTLQVAVSSDLCARGTRTTTAPGPAMREPHCRPGALREARSCGGMSILGIVPAASSGSRSAQVVSVWNNSICSCSGGYRGIGSTRVVTIACNALMLFGGMAYRQAEDRPTEWPCFDVLPALGVGAREIAVIVRPRLIANLDYLRLAIGLLVPEERAPGDRQGRRAATRDKRLHMLNVRRRMSAPGRVRTPATRGMTSAG